MPKRYGNLYEQMFTLDALHAAYLRSRDRKRKKSAVRNFEQNLGANLKQLHDELQAGTYEPRPYKTFYVYEPKPRLIHAPHFRDVVVQQAMYAVLYPLVDSRLCFESYGCRKNKGTHRAADRAQQFLRESPPDSYLLQLDIRKFFYRIDRSVLRKQIERKIKDQRFVDVMMQFADYGEPVGIPIGNLLSQTYALIYLNPLDHYIKRELKAARYCRYVDDFIVFGVSRERCNQILAEVQVFITTLGLELSKYTIAAVRRGINFVGYRTWATRRFIRKHSLFKFSRAIKSEKLDSLISILGHARRTHSLQSLIRSILEKHHELYRSLPQVYRRRAYG